MFVDIMGIKYPASYTIRAQTLIDQQFGGLDQMGGKMQEVGDAGKFDLIADLLAILIEGGVTRGRVECELLGTEYDGPAAISAEAIKQLLKPGEVFDLYPALMDEIRDGYKTTIKLKPPKAKNAKATP